MIGRSTAAVRARWRADPRCCVPLATGRTFDAVTLDLRTGMEVIDLLRRRVGGGLAAARTTRPGPAAHPAVSGSARRPARPRPVLFPTLVDGARGRMRLLLPRGAARWLGGLPAARDVEYHGAGTPIAVPGPAAAAVAGGAGPAWAVRPGAPVERLRGQLGPLAAALETARLTVGWCTGPTVESQPYAGVR
ncbi:hypothetical protein AAHZ94_29590 [Streptomyces sp. HSW2009]|uniref:hypothetical protein n=1 Tax=Streptomyces sp. HSW2009 TaxID=3142890 RepID=UPI0032EDEB66